MPANHLHTDLMTLGFPRQTACLSALALLAVSAFLIPVAAMAAGNSSDANARYQSEIEACKSGRSNQDYATCVKEAGAAQAASNNGRLSDAQNNYQENAMKRCDVLSPEERDACVRMRSGEGTSTGSVGSGGITREIITPDNK